MNKNILKIVLACSVTLLTQLQAMPPKTYPDQTQYKKMLRSMLQEANKNLGNVTTIDDLKQTLNSLPKYTFAHGKTFDLKAFGELATPQITGLRKEITNKVAEIIESNKASITSSDISAIYNELIAIRGSISNDISSGVEIDLANKILTMPTSGSTKKMSESTATETLKKGYKLYITKKTGKDFTKALMSANAAFDELIKAMNDAKNGTAAAVDTGTIMDPIKNFWKIECPSGKNTGYFEVKIAELVNVLNTASDGIAAFETLKAFRDLAKNTFKTFLDTEIAKLEKQSDATTISNIATSANGNDTLEKLINAFPALTQIKTLIASTKYENFDSQKTAIIQKINEFVDALNVSTSTVITDRITAAATDGAQLNQLKADIEDIVSKLNTASTDGITTPTFNANAVQTALDNFGGTPPKTDAELTQAIADARKGTDGNPVEDNANTQAELTAALEALKKLITDKEYDALPGANNTIQAEIDLVGKFTAKADTDTFDAAKAFNAATYNDTWVASMTDATVLTQYVNGFCTNCDKTNTAHLTAKDTMLKKINEIDDRIISDELLSELTNKLAAAFATQS